MNEKNRGNKKWLIGAAAVFIIAALGIGIPLSYDEYIERKNRRNMDLSLDICNTIGLNDIQISANDVPLAIAPSPKVISPDRAEAHENHVQRKLSYWTLRDVFRDTSPVTLRVRITIRCRNRGGKMETSAFEQSLQVDPLQPRLLSISSRCCGLTWVGYAGRSYPDYPASAKVEM